MFARNITVHDLIIHTERVFTHLFEQDYSSTDHAQFFYFSLKNTFDCRRLVQKYRRFQKAVEIYSNSVPELQTVKEKKTSR